MSRRMTSRGRAMRILARRSLLPTWRRPLFLLLGAALGLWLATAGTALPAAGDLDASFGAGGRAIVNLGADETAKASPSLPTAASSSAGRGRTQPGPRRQRRHRRAPDAPGRHRHDLRGPAPAGPSSTTAPTTTSATSSCSRTDGSWPPAPPTLAQRVRRPPREPGRHARPDLRRRGRGLPRPRHRVPMATPRSPYSPTAASWRSGPWRARAPASSDIAAVRLTSAGAFDVSYGRGSGWSRISFPPDPGRPSFDVGSGIALAPDGKIIVAGGTTAPFDEQLRGRAPAQPPGDVRPLVRAGNGTASVPTSGNRLQRGPRSRSSPTGRSSSPAPADRRRERRPRDAPAVNGQPRPGLSAPDRLRASSPRPRCCPTGRSSSPGSHPVRAGRTTSS